MSKKLISLDELSRFKQKEDIEISKACGGLKGIYQTLSALQIAYPSGTKGAFLVTSNKHWYYWNGSAWTDGGAYLSAPFDDVLDETSTNAVQNRVVAKQLNKLNTTNFFLNILYNENFASGTLTPFEIHGGADYVVPTYNNGILTLTCTNAYSGIKYTSNKFVSGHKYYASLYMRDIGTAGTVVLYATIPEYVQAEAKTITTNGKHATIFTASSNNGSIIITQQTGGNCSFSMNDITLFDLTEIFGVGKEPTVGQFEEYLISLGWSYSIGISKIALKLDNDEYIVDNYYLNFGYNNGFSSNNLDPFTYFGGSAYINFTVNNGTLTLTCVYAYTGIKYHAENFISGHKYYACVNVVDIGTATSVTLYGNIGSYIPAEAKVTTTNGKISSVFTASATTGDINIQTDTANSTFSIKDISIYDLTRMFGAGKEPSANEFDAILNDINYVYGVGLLKIDMFSAQFHELDAPCEYSSKSFNSFKKILCIGDSLTEGTFDYMDGDTRRYFVDADYSYPTLLKALSGRDVTNMGVGGDSIVKWYNDHQSTDLSGYDCVIIELGLNDYAGSNPTTPETRATALTALINKLKTENPNGVKVFVSSILSVYPTANAVSLNAELQTIVNSFNSDVYYLDVYSKSSMTPNSSYHNGHLTVLGYNRLAQDYYNYISYIIDNNLNDFKFIQYIGTNYSNS